MLVTSKGPSDEKAARMMAALRDGRTLRKFSITRNCPRFQAYCDAHPEYAHEALPLIEANAKAARLRKGELKRKKTAFVCLKGLHPMIGDNVTIHKGRRQCLACRRFASANPTLRTMTPEIVQKVKTAMRSGASIGQICSGKPVGGGTVDRSLILVRANVLNHYRRVNPEFDRFVAEAIADSNSVGQKIRYTRQRIRAHNEMVRQERNDYHQILAMLPTNFPDKDDVVSDIFEALLDGSLRREDVRTRVGQFIAAHNQDARKYCVGKYGLRSIDAPAFSGSQRIALDQVSKHSMQH